MSYSRWSSSYWYTYWHVQQKDVIENRDNAIFSICMVTDFTAKELRENLEECLKIVEEKEPKGDIDELKIYIKRFLNDVDKHYPKKKI